MVSREDDLSADTIGKRAAGVAIAGFKDDKYCLLRIPKWSKPMGMGVSGRTD